MAAILPALMICAGIAGGAPPQSAAEATTVTAVEKPFPLRSFQIEGNTHFSDEEIIAASGLKIGDAVIPQQFEDALQKLSATGAFNSLRFRYEPVDDGYGLIFEVEEITEFYPIRFEAFEVPKEELMALLAEKVPFFGEQVPPTGPIVERIGDVLNEYWKSKGKQEKVIGTLMPIEDNEFAMIFQPNLPTQTIAYTKFVNTGVLEELEVARVMNSIAIGVPYSEKRLEELLKYNIAPLYATKGYLGVKFCPCKTERDPDTAGLLVTIEVNQGLPYKFGNVELPEIRGLDGDELADMVRFRPGDLANLDLAEEARLSLENRFKNDGYMKADVRLLREDHADSRTVDIGFAYSAGSRYTFRELRIRGLDITGEPAVRKRWAIKVGDPYVADYPRAFLQRIEQEGMFDNLSKTEWKARVDEMNRTVDVELVFH